MSSKFVLIGLSVAIAACAGPAEAPATAPTGLALKRLRVKDATPPELRPIALEIVDLEGVVRLALGLEGVTERQTPGRWLFGPGAFESGWSLSISARVVYGVATREGLAETISAGEAKAVWTAEARVRAPGRPEPVTYYVDAEAGGAFAGDGPALRRQLADHVAAAAVQLAERISSRVTMVKKGPSELLTLLDAAASKTRLAAVEQLAQLRAKVAVPALAKRLTDETEQVIRLRIVGALAEIGDPRAASALISAADPKDRALLRACVDALSVVGGQRVDDFLDVLASHDAPDIREMVEAAQARRAQRRGGR